MTRLPINQAQVRHFRETEERRNAFREGLPVQDTPDGQTVDEEAFGHLMDDLLAHEGVPTADLYSDPSLWVYEDNDMKWIHAPVHSSDVIQKDGTTARVYDEHIEIDFGLMFDQNIEHNRGYMISRHSLRARALAEGNTLVLQHLNERFLYASALAEQRLARESARDAGYVARKVKYFAALVKRARAIGLTEKERIQEFCLRYTAESHPEFLPPQQSGGDSLSLSR